MGFSEPTPIQLRAFPIILSGKDLIGTAQTGTGKTAAFALPIMTLLAKHGDSVARPRADPRTRGPGRDRISRLRALHRPARSRHSTAASVTASRGRQLDAGADIVVATPGRLLDCSSSARQFPHRSTSSSSTKSIACSTWVSSPTCGRSSTSCPSDRQTLFFSATLPPEIERLAGWVLNEPEGSRSARARSPAETVTHAFYPVAVDQKYDLLLALLEHTNFDSVLIFSRTKHGADHIALQLKQEKHSVAVLHSNRTQRERIEALAGFKSGKYEVMVATDIAARGIDVAGVTHVINYDVPENPEDYVHRIGRTGRAQKVGDAFTLMNAEELALQRSSASSGKRSRAEDREFPLHLHRPLRARDRRRQTRHRRRPHPSRLFLRPAPSLGATCCRAGASLPSLEAAHRTQSSTTHPTPH